MSHLSRLCILAVLLGICNAASSDETSSHRGLAHFSLVELQGGSSDALTRLHRALQTEGAIVVTGAPGLEDTAADALDDFSECLRQRPKSSIDSDSTVAEPLRRILAGGVERSTLATLTKDRVSQPLPSWTDKICPRFKESSVKLRAIVAWLVELVSHSVDVASGARMTAASRNFEESTSASQRMQDIVRHGTHIEHFHRYSSLEGASNHSQTTALALIDQKQPLQMHTDMGLFQALAIRWRSADGKAGLNLEVELPDGSTVSVEPSSSQGASSAGLAHGNGLLFLVGQGASEWMPHLKLRPAPHVLALRSTFNAERFVYGVMVLPPEHWPLPGPRGLNTTFGEWWRRAWLAITDDSSDKSSDAWADVATNQAAPHPLAPADLGCLSAVTLHRRLKDLSNSCPSGSMYCWMQCVETGHLPCREDLVVCSSQSGQTCNNDVHDATCAPKCKPSWDKSVATPSKGGDFCNGIMTDMHMTGFVWNGEERPCLILLFPGWELTDGARFWLANLGTVIAGIFAEYLIAVRRKQDLRNKSKFDRNNSRFHGILRRTWCLTLYAGNRAVGYFVMLITMTYSVELFIAVLFGLSIGHALFNMALPADGDLTPCCQDLSGVEQSLVPGQNGLPRPLGQAATPSGKLRFVVTGMTCSACLITVRNAVEAVGVVQAVTEFSLSSGELEVELKSAIGAQDHFASVEPVCRAVQDVGFSVEQVNFGSSSQPLSSPADPV